MEQHLPQLKEDQGVTKRRGSNGTVTEHITQKVAPAPALPRVVVLVDDMWGIGEHDEELGVLVVVERYSSFRKARAAL